ncbi:MAG: AsmA-like C-terminal region-containing protein, partial [Planctomycetota bacterium]
IVVPEFQIKLDRDRFREAERIEVRSLTLLRPSLTLVRRADGTWNLADLLPLVSPDPAPNCPAWDIRDATVRLVFESSAQDPTRGPLAATLHGVNVSLLPDSKRSYRVRGAGGVAGSSDPTVTRVGGGVHFDGAIDLDRGRWSLSGGVRGLELGGGLLADAALGSPEFQAGLLAARERFSAAEARLAGEPTPLPNVGGPVRVVSADANAFVRPATAREPQGPVRLTDFGLDGDLAATFSLSAGSFEETPEYDVTVTCRSGTLVNRFLPFPLSNVRGSARIADGEVRLIEATGRHGETVAQAEGLFRPSPFGMEGWLSLSASRVPVTRRDGPRLPDALRRLHTLLSPEGTLDIRRLRLESAPQAANGRTWKPWTLTQLDLEALDGTVRPQKFPYPFRNARGTAAMDAEGVLNLDFRGTAAGRPGAFRGWVRNLGPEFEFRGAGRLVGVPLDRTFRDACPKPARTSVEHLALEGVADAEITLHRPPGPLQPVVWTLRSEVRHASVQAQSFPYRIDGLSGIVSFDSREGVWKFEELRGVHGAAELAGSASFDLNPRPGRLRMTVTALGTPLDRSLRQALPEEPRRLWDSLAPTRGTADLKIGLGWIPGQPVRLDLPSIKIADAALRPAAFPLPLERVNAVGSWQSAERPRGGVLRLTSLSAVHADRTPDGPTVMRTTGLLESRFAETGEWSLSIDDLACDRFAMGPTFLAALPPRLQRALEELQLTGPIDLRVPSLNLRGMADGSAATTAAWKAVAVVDGNTARLGPTTRLGSGTIACEGSFDGVEPTMTGLLQTSRADLLEHTLFDVRAPFRLKGDVLLAGSPDVPNGDRITAIAYGGVLRADVAANLAQGPAYRLQADLNGAKLGEYALQKMGGAKNLQGNLRGRLTLSGRGADTRTVRGDGVVEIEPAALGELNVVLRLFKAVNMNDPTMFYSAGAKFDLADETVNFRRIDLRGEAISFTGRGRVGMNGGLDLEFFSKAPSTWVPIVRALSTGWVGVKVRGTTWQPIMDTFSPPVDSSLQAFLTPFSPLISKPPPRTAGSR